MPRLRTTSLEQQQCGVQGQDSLFCNNIMVSIVLCILQGLGEGIVKDMVRVIVKIAWDMIMI